MEWEPLTDLKQIEELHELSFETPVLIYKHSTRCSTSRVILDRLERNWAAMPQKALKPFFLDLISYRQVSNAIAAKFEVEHESPQVLVIKNGLPVYNGAHFEISYQKIIETL